MQCACLVIEDHPKINSFIRRGLMQEHYAVIPPPMAKRALLAEDPAYDLVILDMMLPKLTGMQVRGRIRENRKHLPVLMLTAKDSVEHIVAALDAGADDYLRKPYQFSELTERTRAVQARDAPGMIVVEEQSRTLLVGVVKRERSRAGIVRRSRLGTDVLASACGDGCTVRVVPHVGHIADAYSLGYIQGGFARRRRPLVGVPSLIHGGRPPCRWRVARFSV